ncbi:MAG: PEP-utilizing enzyme [Actinomycetota bacterium]|nr:PEP-utilizing enzyme [Actinomycetota bacterium]
MDDTWITDWPVSERWPHYTRANAGEVLPTPASPLGLQFSWNNGMVPGWRDGYVRSGNYSLDEFDPDLPETVGFFGGYFYINLANVRMQGVRSPAVTVDQLDLAFFGDHPDVPPYEAHPDDERPDLLEKIGAHLGWLMSTSEWPEIDDQRDETIAFRVGRPDLPSLSDNELVARARSTQPMLQQLFETHCVTSSGSGVAPGILFAIAEAIGDPTVPMKLVAGIGGVDSAEPSYRMWTISRSIRSSQELTSEFDEGIDSVLDRIRASDSEDAQAFMEAWDAFIHDFGSRGPNEYEMSSEVWETNPTLALAALDRVRHQSDDESPTIRNQAKAQERLALVEDVRDRVGKLGNEELSGQYEAALVAANQLWFRERTKTNIVRVIHEARMAFRELGRRHAEAGNLEDPSHIFMLLNEEVESFVAEPSSLTATLVERHGQWLELWDLEPPFIIRDGEVPPLSQWPNRGKASADVTEVGEVLQGVPGCPGTVRGTARVVLDPHDPGNLTPGDIMVAPLTDPAWTPLFMTAAGVVVDVGGQISHAVIVSRELGLPCVVSVEHASIRIPDGATIEVDGDTGQVTVLDLPS